MSQIKSGTYTRLPSPSSLCRCPSSLTPRGKGPRVPFSPGPGAVLVWPASARVHVTQGRARHGGKGGSSSLLGQGEVQRLDGLPLGGLAAAVIARRGDDGGVTGKLLHDGIEEAAEGVQPVPLGRAEMVQFGRRIVG